MIGQTIRDYHITEEIGSGGYGTVYRAHQTGVGRDVAIKIIHPQHSAKPEFVRRFESEARLVARLEHPHIVPLYAYWRDDDGAYLVMRDIKGGSLRRILNEHGPLNLHQAVDLVQQLAAALDAAHRFDVVHRDLKPDNILLDDLGNVYLTDFGIAKALNTGDDLTATDAVVGTLKYAAPEQLQGATITTRADLYALGLLIYEALTGQYPYETRAVADLMMKHLQEPLPKINDQRPDLPAALDDLLQRATAKNPAERPAKASDIARALHALLQPGPTTSPETALQADAEPQTATFSAVKDRNRRRMLEKVQRFWIDGVLKNSLEGVARMELGLEPIPEAVDHPWSMVLHQAEQLRAVVPMGTPIQRLYDDLDGEMLILGAPGSGKTTLLLTLVETLLQRAAGDPDRPMPVVFNLSSWAYTRKPLQEWLVDELNARYQVPRVTAEAWLARDQIAPLLDGLDEVALKVRDHCVSAINDFRQAHGLLPTVVCSRVKDYGALKTRLKLQGAVLLQPLTPGQVDAYLAANEHNADLAAVRAIFEDDEKLRRLTTTPLMLNIAVLAYRGLDFEDIPAFETLEGRREHLFETYITRMMERRGGKNRYDDEQTRHYLRILAARMHERAQSVFHIETVQPDWLPERGQQRRFRLYSIFGNALLSGGVVMVVTLFMFLMLGLFGFVVTAGATGLGLGALLTTFLTVAASALVVGPFFAVPISLGILATQAWRKRARANIQPVDAQTWSWSEAFKRLPMSFGLGAGLSLVTFGVSTGLTYLAAILIDGALRPDQIPGFMVGMLAVTVILTGIPGVILDVIRYGYRVADIDEKTRPNEGIRRSLTSWGRFTTLVGSAIGTLVFVGYFLFMLAFGASLAATLGNALAFGFVGLTMGLFIGGLYGLLFRGGSAVLDHVILRRMLARNEQMPLNVAEFLDEASNNILLRKVGGGYIFVHRMLLEHLANQGLEGGLEAGKLKRGDLLEDDDAALLRLRDDGMSDEEFAEIERAMNEEYIEPLDDEV